MLKFELIAVIAQNDIFRGLIIHIEFLEFIQPFALEDMGIDRSEVLMVGDRVSTDIIGARRAGIASVLVKTGEFKESDLIGDVQPDYTVNAINEIESFF